MEWVWTRGGESFGYFEDNDLAWPLSVTTRG